MFTVNRYIGQTKKKDYADSRAVVDSLVGAQMDAKVTAISDRRVLGHPRFPPRRV
jgi:hypothetical protein